METTIRKKEEPLADQLQCFLKACPHVKGYKLYVKELPHAIVIGGTVNSFYQKQMAQETVAKFLKPRVQQGLRVMLKNEIVVKPVSE